MRPVVQFISQRDLHGTIKRFIIVVLILLVTTCMSSDQYSSAQSIKTASISHTLLPDLQFICFESWWSELNNGTTYIRYLVNNTADTYTTPYQQILLNISLLLDEQTIPFAYVNQTSFIDPFTWYKGETIGGCTQVHLTEKPQTITAVINSNSVIPESNMSNNIKTTPVVHGILISGIVTEEENGTLTPLSEVSIRQCDPVSLQTSLYIRFDATTDGAYTVCLYPLHPLSAPHQYDLLFTDHKRERTIHMTTLPLYYNETTTLTVSFTSDQPQQPFRPLGFPLGFQGKTQMYCTKTKDTHSEKVYYKFQWEKNSYSDWLGALASNRLVVATHHWQNRGIYQIRVIAKDANGQLSKWSLSTYVCII